MDRRLLLPIVATLALGACTWKPYLQADLAPGANLGAYRTYAWSPQAPPEGTNLVAYERMKSQVEASLAAKGYVPGRPADLTLVLTVASKDRVGTYLWVGPNYWNAPYDVIHYPEGTVTLDVLDARTRRALWHGSAVQALQPDGPNPKTDEAAISGVMSRFPARG